MQFPRFIGSWIIIDSGTKSGREHMAMDSFALNELFKQDRPRPYLRFFQWNEPTVSYGFMMDPTEVRTWAHHHGVPSIVKRPTGGGTVLHTPYDLSFSLLWPRGADYLSDNPRDCYREIHSSLIVGLHVLLRKPNQEINLHAPVDSSITCMSDSSSLPAATEPKPRFSVCFEEPVCNDVMQNGEKILGGALRITRHAVLYQGHLKLDGTHLIPQVKSHLLLSLATLFAERKEKESLLFL